MACSSSAFHSARLLLKLPSSFRTAFFQQHCRVHNATLQASRWGSSSSQGGQRGIAQKSKAIRANNHAVAQKPIAQVKGAYKPAEKPLRSGYANYIEAIVGRGHREPILLYKAPSHTNYYIACGAMSVCFALAAAGSANSIHATYWNREVLWWQLPLLGIATGACLWFVIRTTTATRKLIHELWLLPRGPGDSVSTPRLVEVRCRSWPLPTMRDRTWTAPLEDMTLSRTYGSTFYGTERERDGRHSIASDVARDAAELHELEARQRQRDGVMVTKLLGIMERVKQVVAECKQVLHWYGLNAWLVVKGQGAFKLDGRGLMLQGGRGLDSLFKQYKG